MPSSSSTDPVRVANPTTAAPLNPAEVQAPLPPQTEGARGKGASGGPVAVVDSRPFLDWLSEDPVATNRPTSNPTANSDEAAVAQWVVAKHPLAWETPAHLKTTVSTTVAAPVAATSQPTSAAVNPTDDLDKVQSAHDLDSDDLALLQQILEPSGQWAPWAMPPTVQVAQAWVNEATDQAANAVSGTGTARLSGQMERLLRWSAASGKSVRVVIDDSLAVILRIRQGRVSADFMPQGVQSAEVASRLAAMQSQLDELKQRLAAQNLPVDAMRARLGRGTGGEPQQHQPPPNPEQSSPDTTL